MSFKNLKNYSTSYFPWNLTVSHLMGGKMVCFIKCGFQSSTYKLKFTEAEWNEEWGVQDLKNTFFLKYSV